MLGVEVKKEQESIKVKQEKSLSINKRATLSDQLNALMEVTHALIEFIAKGNPELLENLAIKNWLDMRTDIKNILNK